jgi:superoxide reductase
MQLYEIYVCKHCGAVVEVLKNAGGKLTCCGEAMQLQSENTVDAAKEKHVPVVTINGTSATVAVGAVAHPMEEKHFIVSIEVQQGDKIQRVQLQPGQEPKAVFTIDPSQPVVAREYCTLHGLWKS